ncbi:MAG: thioredoxin domain-containing protein [Gammaproteobacteria bacterium]|nr:thioredoxin domain-containing protein [Gammaproteobacteria bacterium]
MTTHPATAPPAAVVDADEESFEIRVIDESHRRLVLVDFWAAWCAPCVALTPTLESLAGEYRGCFLLAKVEVDDNMRLAGRYKLRGFPTVILFRNGEQVAHFVGNKPRHHVRELVQAHI